MIEIENVTKRYDGRLVVDDVSLVIEPHKIVTIVGMSGSGKTTLLRMINRLVQRDSGCIRLDGTDNELIPGHILRRSIGYAIQGDGLFPHRSVAENIATVPRLLGWDKQRIHARVTELLALFQLDPVFYAERFPHQLSGGQRQRVGVARALAAGPNVLLMDEPFGALDPIIRSKARDDLLAIHRAIGTTIVMVTHDMDEAVTLGDRIAVMDAGRLLQYASPADIMANPASPFVETLVGSSERPFRMLSFGCVADIVEPGEAEGAPIALDASLRDALAELLWSGRSAIPVHDDNGMIVGQAKLKTVLNRAAKPV